MADGTKIEWTDATVNAVNGCSVVSPGCTNCYAMRLAGTRLRNHPSRAGLTQDSKAGPVWNGTVKLNETALRQPLSWRRPRRIFWNAHGDLFHPSVPFGWVDEMLGVWAATPQHIHHVLTKRPERMLEYFSTLRQRQHDLECWASADFVDWPLPNVWLGTSVEDQRRADERIPHLLATPAAVRFLSCEPLLGPIDLRALPVPDSDEFDCSNVKVDALTGYHRGVPKLSGQPCRSLPPITGSIDWVIVGGESGPGARPMHPDWARSLRDQCNAAGVAFFFKQWGEFAPEGLGREKWIVRADGSHDPMPTPNGIGHHQPRDGASFVYRVGKKADGRLLDGVEHNGMPA